MPKTIKPDPEDYQAVQRLRGRLRPNATDVESAEAYRDAQAHKLIRLWKAGRLDQLGRVDIPAVFSL